MHERPIRTIVTYRNGPRKADVELTVNRRTPYRTVNWYDGRIVGPPSYHETEDNARYAAARYTDTRGD